MGFSSGSSYLNITCDEIHPMLCALSRDSLFTSCSRLFSSLPPLGRYQPHHLSKVKVRDLEQQCRSQSEHYQQLSKELLNFRLQSETADILKIKPTSTSQRPLSQEKKLSQVIFGLKPQPETGGSVVQTSEKFWTLKIKKIQIVIIFLMLLLQYW